MFISGLIIINNHGLPITANGTNSLDQSELQVPQVPSAEQHETSPKRGKT